MRNLWIVFLFVIATMSSFARAQERSDVIRLDSALDDIVPPGAKVEKMPGTFVFTESPVWVRQGAYLLFSDLRANVINKWSPGDGQFSVFLGSSGSAGTASLGGPNGMTLDRQGRIVYCAQDVRQVVRLEEDGRHTVLASEYEGQRLNAPNDLVYKSNGALYFTDPAPRGQGQSGEPPRSGVYLLKAGKLQLLTQDLSRPNGLAFSLDEKYLYLIDTARQSILRFKVQPDDTIANGQVFVDMSADKTPGSTGGMKLDQKGNIYSTGPGGVWVISPQGRHLGTILIPELPSNVTFGETDGKTLFVTDRTGLYWIRLKIPGIQP